MNDLILTNALNTGFMASDSLTKIDHRFNLVGQQKVLHSGFAISSISVYCHPSYGGLNRVTTAFIYADLESKQVIQEYFKSSPQKRKGLRTLAADSVKSPNSVFEVLEWSTKTDIREAYDAAVDLLACICDVTLQVARYPTLEHLILERKVATLISGIARARHIPITERLKVVLQHTQSNKRMVKESVVDALSLLADEEIDNKVYSSILPTVKFYLTWFASDKQPDTFIQRYARDVINDIL